MHQLSLGNKKGERGGSIIKKNRKRDACYCISTSLRIVACLPAVKNLILAGNCPPRSGKSATITCDNRLRDPVIRVAPAPALCDHKWLWQWGLRDMVSPLTRIALLPTSGLCHTKHLFCAVLKFYIKQRRVLGLSEERNKRRWVPFYVAFVISSFVCSFHWQ